jgi:hypothetical protein
MQVQLPMMNNVIFLTLTLGETCKDYKNEDFKFSKVVIMKSGIAYACRETEDGNYNSNI